MRPGHNSSGSSEEGFESTIDVQPSLMTVEQSQLVDQHRSEGETLGVDQPSCGHLSVHLEDGLEMLIEVLVGHAAQLVEDAPDFDAIVGVRVSSSFSGNQEPLLGASEACLSDVGGVVVNVSEYEAGLVRQLLDEVGSYQVVCCVGGGEPSRQRNPNLTHGDGQMQLPPVHPPMPAALSPVSFGVYGCMGHLACFVVFLVPHSTFCLQNGAVEGYSSSLLSQGLSISTRWRPRQPICSGKLSGKAFRRLSKVRLEGKRPSSERESRTMLISEVGSSRTAKSSPTLCSLLTIMITRAFIKSFSE